MKTYFVLFFMAAIFSFVLTPIVRRLCVSYRWLDEPGEERRVHYRAVPRLGGVAVCLATVAALTIVFLLNSVVLQMFVKDKTPLILAMLPALLIFLLGIYDDLHGVSPRIKLLAQILAASVFYLLGGRIEILSLPFVHSLTLPPVLGFAITILWVVIVTNAFNLIDGLDGLAAGTALFSALIMTAVSLVTGQWYVTVIMIALSGALAGFLPYNFNPASIFLGDSGSLFVGFLLATLAVEGPQKASTAVAIAIPLMAFGLPLVDTSITLFRRFVSRKPLFQGDREHIHHMLLARGWSQRRAVLVLYSICALFGLQALLFTHDGGIGRITGLGLIGVGIAIVLSVKKLRYHEVDEFRAALRHHFSLRENHRRAADNIRIRRASQSLSQAKSLQEIYHAVQEIMASGEFIRVVVRLDSGNPALNAQVLEHEREAAILRNAVVKNDGIHWTWTQAGVATPSFDSARFITLHLPLATTRSRWGFLTLFRENDNRELQLDLNCLRQLFQHQLALAAERVFDAVSVEALPSKREESIRMSPALSRAAVGSRQTAADPV